MRTSANLRAARGAALGWCRGAIVASAVSAAIAPRAGAAEVRIVAPDGCIDAATVGEQVDVILGRPLSAVEDLDFELRITEGTTGSFQLRLDTIDRGNQSRRTRALEGHSCAELADAAAVAIAMTVKAGADDGPARPSAPTAPLTPSPDVATAHAAAAPVVPAPSAAGPRLALAVRGVADDGALPKLSLGIGLEAAAQFRVLRVIALADLFPSQETKADAQLGGNFQLAVAGLLACATHHVSHLILLGCAGGEGGRLSGEGVGVSNPRVQSELWLAGRGELGTNITLGPRLALSLRAGATVPALRPTFFVDGTTRLHRPSAVTTRGTLAIEIAL